MSSDSNYNFDFVVEEILELGHLDVSTLRKNSYSDSGVNSQRIISREIEV